MKSSGAENVRSGEINPVTLIGLHRRGFLTRAADTLHCSKSADPDAPKIKCFHFNRAFKSLNELLIFKWSGAEKFQR